MHLGFAGNAGKAEPAREQAFVHHAAGPQVRGPASHRDHRAEIPRVGHGVAHHGGIVNRVPAVGEQHDRPASSSMPNSVISSPSAPW
jgi:hypothetical protein